jgi:hypothetical protein
MNCRRNVQTLLVAATVATGVLRLIAAQDQKPALPQSAPGPARDKPAAPKPTGVIRGFVVDAQTGAPLRGAIVRAGMRPPASASANVSTVFRGEAIADTEGRFEIRDVPAGSYSLSAMRTGYLPMTYGQRRPQGPGTLVDIGDAQTLEKITIAMFKGGVIAGRVFDEFGEPVAGAQVRALQYRFDGGARRLTPANAPGGSASTDDLGGFRLYGLEAGQFYVSARPQNQFQMGPQSAIEPRNGPTTTFFPDSLDPSGAQRLAVAAGKETGPILLTLVSTRLATIRGRALMSTGEPFTSAFIQATVRDALGDISGGFQGGGVRPGGNFEIPRLAAGTYELTVRTMNNNGPNDDSEVGRATVSVAGEDVNDVLITGGKPAVARGRFVSDDGTPLPFKGTSIGLGSVGASYEERFGNYSPGRVADDLTFEIRGLHGTRKLNANLFQGGDPGGWHVKAVIWDGNDVTDTGIAFTPNRIYDSIDIVLTKSASELSGVVTDERGNPFAEVWLIAFAADETTWTWQSRFTRVARTTRDGSFRFTMLRPRSDYLLAVVPEMEQGQWQDPDFLKSIKTRATALSLADGEKKIQNLQVQRVTQ